MASSPKAPTRAKKTNRSTSAASRPRKQAPAVLAATNDTPTTVRSPRPHPLLVLPFTGPKASVTNDESAVPPAGAAAPSSAPANKPGGPPEGGGPPSSSSLGPELLALRALVAKLRGTVDVMIEDLDELDERTRQKAAAKACAPVLAAARGRVATFGETLSAVEARLARAAEHSSSPDDPAPAVPDLVSVDGEPSAAELEAVGVEWAIMNVGAYLDSARKDLALGKLQETFAGIDAAAGCNRMAAKYIEHVLTPLRLARGADPRNGQRIDGRGAGAIPPPPAPPLPQNPRCASVDAAKLSIEDIANARQLIVAVRPALQDLWWAARDGSAPKGDRTIGRRERRQKVDDGAYDVLALVRCAEEELETILRAARAARKVIGGAP